MCEQLEKWAGTAPTEISGGILALVLQGMALMLCPVGAGRRGRMRTLCLQSRAVPLRCVGFFGLRLRLCSRCQRGTAQKARESVDWGCSKTVPSTRPVVSKH